MSSLPPISLLIALAASLGASGTVPSSTATAGGASIATVGCLPAIADSASPTNCLEASSEPALGKLFPIDSRLFVAPGGNVGIGTTAPTSKLSVAGSVSTSASLRTNVQGGFVALGQYSASTVPAIDMKNAAAVNSWLIYPSNASTSNLHIYSRLSSGTVRIAAHEGDVGHLWVEGDTSSRTITIRGGSDVVESFWSAGGTIEPGTVVVIDESGERRVRESNVPYARGVIGVVSGAGGIASGLHLQQDGRTEGDTKIAMMGQVYVRCSAENGAIGPGDLLTNAALSGHAMRASDHERSFGAVLGKALGTLERDTGLVLALVNLQ